MKNSSVAILLLAAMGLLVTQRAAAYVPSPRYGAFELKFGPYLPDSDAIPYRAGSTNAKLSYDQLFADEKNMLNSVIELDWQFARIPDVLSFGLGFSIGIMHAEGKAQVTDETGALVDSADSTDLYVLPLAIQAVLRIDVLADKLDIPFVPYYKIGPNWYVWWTKTDDKRRGSGGTLGWQMSPGLALRLDWIDETTARTFDNEVGVNNSYIFFEILYAEVNGFGQTGKLPLSPTNIWSSATWLLGLCLEF